MPSAAKNAPTRSDLVHSPWSPRTVHAHPLLAPGAAPLATPPSVPAPLVMPTGLPPPTLPPGALSVGPPSAPPEPNPPLHCPAAHVPPFGQTTPWHVSTHAPALHTVPAPHGVAHERSTHAPDVSSQLSGAEHVMPPHAMQLGRHTPCVHTSPVAQATPAQRFTQLSPMHVWPWGQTTPWHAATQVPVGSHTWSALHVTPRHLGSTHRPVAWSQLSESAHGFSALPQCATHWPLTQMSPALGHVAPSSTVPSQSSSRPLQTSG
jgi:hypothetical protein